MKGMITCKICGRDFPLIKEEHYVAQDPKKVGALANVLSTDRAFEFDAFDCPHCGCQNVVQGRKTPTFHEDGCPCDYGVCDECDHQGEYVKDEYHGCDNCKHQSKEIDEYPCIECSQAHCDFWEKGEENGQ